MVRHLHGGARPGMRRQGLDEGPEVHDVVEDVMADDELGSGDAGGHVGPAAGDGLHPGAGGSPGSQIGEGAEHPRIGVHGGDEGRLCGEGQRRRPCPGADVENRPPRRQGLLGPPVRGLRPLHRLALGPLGEDPVGEGPGRLGGRGEDLLGDAPAGQVPAPGREEPFGSRRHGVPDPSSLPPWALVSACPAEAVNEPLSPSKCMVGWLAGAVWLRNSAARAPTGPNYRFPTYDYGYAPQAGERRRGQGRSREMGQVSKVAPRAKSDAALRTRAPDQLDPLALYLDAMGRYPLLTDGDEAER